MTRFKILIMTCALISPIAISAEEYSWLTFQMIDNSKISVASDNLSINYSNGELHLKSNTVSQQISVSEVKSMEFTSSAAAGVEGITSDSVSREKDFYTLSGSKAGTFGSVDEAKLKLPSGIYLVVDGDNAFKVIF